MKEAPEVYALQKIGYYAALLLLSITGMYLMLALGAVMN